MCQPGRPGPHGEGHATSSSGFVAFQSAKSAGDSFPSPGSMRAPCDELVDALAR